MKFSSYRPQQFDVMIMTNLYGNIVSNVACGLIGGPGLLSGQNIGANVNLNIDFARSNHLTFSFFHQYAVFEPGTRNSGANIAGKNIANPIAMLTAGADLLQYLKLHHHAQLIYDAIYKTINIDLIHTPGNT